MNTHAHDRQREASPRFSGTLKKWNGDRGFGFVAAEHGDQDLFVHISAFPRDGGTPTEGEALSFEIELDRDGRKRAVRVRRPGTPVAAPSRRRNEQGRGQEQGTAHRAPRRTDTTGSSLPFMRVVVLLMAAGLGWFGYQQYMAPQPFEAATPTLLSDSQPAAPASPSQTFWCDGRKHCSQMTSCQEATYFLKHCPGVQMDGDSDGVPCEQQWCSSPFAR